MLASGAPPDRFFTCTLNAKGRSLSPHLPKNVAAALLHFSILLSDIVARFVFTHFCHLFRFRVFLKCNSTNGLRSVSNNRRIQVAFNEFSNSGEGTAQLSLSAFGPTTGTGTGTGSGTSVASSTTGGNTSSTNAGQSAGLSTVAGYAYYGELLGYSTSTGYSDGYGGFATTPSSSSSISGSATGNNSSTGGSKGSGGKKKSSSGGSTNDSPPASSSSFNGTTGGGAGGSSYGLMATYGVFGTGSTYGAFAGRSVGEAATESGSTSGGSGATGGQEGSGYAIGGGVTTVNAGSSGSDFVSGLGVRN
jgi:hypothetical protein